MDISVIICTYNRSNHLRNVLRSLSEQVVPNNLEWEIVVVDNNSTDDTIEVVKDFGNDSSLPIKYIKEEKQGLSHARNRGILESKGKYVAFTDDDAITDRNWVTSLYEAFQKYGCDCVGGRIYLRFASEMPRWLKRELWGFFGFLDHGHRAFEVIDEHIFGGNMAFSKEILNKSGFFNPNRGRTATVLIGGEELELLKRVKSAGGKIIYQPAALVYHVIGSEKLKKQYFRKLHYYEGVISGKSFSEPIRRHITGIPLFIFSQFIRSVMNYFRNPALRMQMNIWWFLGFMRGRMAQFRKS